MCRAIFYETHLFFLHSIWIFMTLYRALTELSFQAKCKWQNRSRGFTPIC